MSIENSIRKIQRSLGIKKCLIIDGNVGDVFLYKGRIQTLRDILKDMLNDMNFREIIYWDRIEGCVEEKAGSMASLDTGTDVNVSGEEYSLDEGDIPESDDNAPVLTKPEEFLPLVYRNLKNESKKSAFILNWCEYLFTKNDNPEDERPALTILAKALKDRRVAAFNDDFNESTVVIIVNRISSIPLALYQGNPEVEIINMSVPDRLERKDIMKSIADSFNVKMARTESLSTSKNLSTYVDMLDGFTNREIVQLARLSRKNANMSFEKLFYLFRYGEKENPWEKLEIDRLRDIKQILSESVVGQNQAIQKIEAAIIKAYMGLTGLHKTSSRSMPKGVFFFVGPTGVGKTELSKALAKFLFGDEQACIRFDMSEYAQDNSDQKLIGAPPGYVGYEEGGQLTNAVREKPFSVILFDEIEKAAKPNPRILDIFLQILEDGRLTDSKGDTVYFSDTIIIFTSNLGAAKIRYNGNDDETASEFIKEVKDYFDNELKRPELLGRIGYNNIVPFNFIQSEEFIYKIASSKLKPIDKGIYEKYALHVVYADEKSVLSYILTGLDKAKGGRQVLNAINDRLLDPLARFLFDNKEELHEFKEGSIEIKVNTERSGLEFSFV